MSALRTYALLLAWCVLVAPRLAADEPLPQLTAAAGIEGWTTPGRWLPVAVTIQQPGTAWRGDLVVGWEGAAGTRETQQRAIELPAGSRQRCDFLLPGLSGGDVTVELRDASGATRAQTVAPCTSFAGTPLVVLLADSWLGLDTYARPASPVTVARLDLARLPAQAAGWDAADAVLIGAVPPERWPTPAARAALLDWVRDGGCVALEWKTLAAGFFPTAISMTTAGQAAEMPAEVVRARAGATTAPGGAIPTFGAALPDAWCADPPGSGVPLVQTLPCGRGRVLILSVSFELPPLRDWPESRRLWATVLGMAWPVPTDDAPVPLSRALDAGVLSPAERLEHEVPGLRVDASLVGWMLWAAMILLPLGFWLYLRRLRAATGARFRGLALVWVWIAGAAGVAAVASLSAADAPGGVHSLHFVRCDPGATTARGRSVVRLALDAGAVDLTLADPEGALALDGRMREVLRTPARRFTRDEVPLRHEPDRLVFRALDLGRREVLALAAAWRAPMPMLDGLTVRRDGPALIVHNGASTTLIECFWWDGARLWRGPKELTGGAEAAIARDPGTTLAWPRQPQATAPEPGAIPEPVLRLALYAPEQATVGCRFALAELVRAPGYLARGEQLLWFHCARSPGVLTGGTDAVREDAWTFVEWRFTE